MSFCFPSIVGREISVLWRTLLLAFFSLVLGSYDLKAETRPGTELFQEEIQPILEEYCYACHGYGMNEGSVTLDHFASPHEALEERELWWRALRMLRASMMPPADMPQLNNEQVQKIEQWIKQSVFEIDPENPDPGRGVLQRLNRVEYRNTVRDLLGVDFDTKNFFPPENTGHGFDNLGEVLTISPLLMEKYMDAARRIIDKAVPKASRVVPETEITGQYFRPEGRQDDAELKPGPRWLSYYEPATVSHKFHAPHPGSYRLVVKLQADEHFVDNLFDYNRCRLTFSADNETLIVQEFSRQGGKPFQFEFEVDWEEGEHSLVFNLEPLTPEAEQLRDLRIRLRSVVIQGPFDQQHWPKPDNYERFFPRETPENAQEKRDYAREILRKFATRAFRRPVDEATVDRLATLAASIFQQDGVTFEAGIAEAMVAVLASPRFLFREEVLEKRRTQQEYPHIDEYSLASRLSYFLWSTMPDEELFRLAEENQLRENLEAQVDRMLSDSRSQQFVRHFTGQWLRARDVESVLINPVAVMQREEEPNPELERMRERFRELRQKPSEELTPSEKEEIKEARESFLSAFRKFRKFDLNDQLRRAMRRETEMLFDHILREDRSLSELLESDYTFLNEPLAKHYGIEGVEGNEMRQVTLPADSPRGGILTQGTMLIVTSNPSRTSPVKRGLYILDNILGTPPPPPPPDIPALEDAGGEEEQHALTLREAMAIHRKDPLCSSCHLRMDPLGLALEQFNALGRWRDKERGKPIDPSGELLTGEEFQGVQELKKILASDHKMDFYRCLTEKMLIYALGRGLDYHDVETVDQIVNSLDQAGGRPSVLFKGIVRSAPFQKSRPRQSAEETDRLKTAKYQSD